MLNLLDAILTYYGLQHSYINEANPLMNALYEAHPLLFLAVKFGLSCLLYVLSVFKTFHPPDWIKGLSVAASVGYTCVCLYHGYWIVLIM